MIWLGDRTGYLPDAITQFWVRTTGTRVNPRDCLWLDGPIGDTRRIGKDFFERLATRDGLSVREGKGLLTDASVLAGRDASRKLHPAVADFYENTAEYRIDAWSEWNGAFKPFGVLLARIFSRRLEQLNLPLNNLETSRGMTSRILEVVSGSGEATNVAWVRTLVASGRTIYSGNYRECEVSGFDGKCLRVSFPLPNGNATVILWPEVQRDGSLTLMSWGERFGDPGFYFVLRHGTRVYARYVRAMRERIRVYAGEDGELRSDHHLWFCGRTFLRLHYRLSRTRAPMVAAK